MDKYIYFKPDTFEDYGGNFAIDITNIFPNIASKYLGEYNCHGFVRIGNGKNMVWKFDTWSAEFSYILYVTNNINIFCICSLCIYKHFFLIKNANASV